MSGLDTSFARGMPSGLFAGGLAALGQKAERPTAVTLTVGTPAAASDTVVEVTASSAATIVKGTILDFAGVQVVVTADTVVGVTPEDLPVRSVENKVGLSEPIDAAEEAVWNGYHRVYGTSSAPLNISETTNQLRSTTYDSNLQPEWDETQITGKGWTLGRQGNFKPHDPAWLLIRQAANTGQEIHVLRILPDESGAPARFERGRAIITGYSDDPPADGIITASWTFTGQGELEYGTFANLSS